MSKASVLLAERLQFDGDAPELRPPGSPLPRGSFPAVPVRTRSLCPRVQTAQLLWARQEIQDALDLLPDQKGEVPGYSAGAEPPLMALPEGVLWADQAKSQRDVTLALYSTQGVRSSRQALEDHLRGLFPDLFFDLVSDNDLRARRRKLYPWMETPSGLFAPAVVALEIFRRTIQEEPNVFQAEVRSIVSFPDRIFGWELRLA